MEVAESLRIGWRNVRAHPLRSTLTTLGIVIGVATVITFVTLGASLQADVVQTLAGENTNLMFVSAVGDDANELAALTGGGQAVFTEHDVRRLEAVPGVTNVIPEGGIPASKVTHANDSVGRQWVTTTDPVYFRAKGYEFVDGRPFRPGSQEVVLNERAAAMFEENVSVGDQLTITGPAGGETTNVTVTGVVRDSANSRSSLFGQSTQPAVYAPTVPFYRRTVVSPSTGTEQRVYARLILTVEDFSTIATVQGRVASYLGEESDARRLKPETYRFEVATHEQLVSQIERVSSTFTAYISSIAVISLVVGAIGIANVMLVSVTERTREIGIMKAVGARRRDVLELFLVEAVILGVLGAAFGSVVGLAGGYASASLIGLPFRFQPWWLVGSVIIGMAVGVLAGLYPAWTASTTDPIDALRRE